MDNAILLATLNIEMYELILKKEKMIILITSPQSAEYTDEVKDCLRRQNLAMGDYIKALRDRIKILS